MNEFKISTLHQDDLMQYFQEWMTAHEDLLECGFSWASLMENEEWNQYMSLDVMSFSSEFMEELQFDTICFTRLVQATYKLVMKHPKYFSMLGLPIDTWECAADEWSKLFSYFCRYDVIPTNKGNKFIEINSDTPTGYIESSLVNDYLCRLHKVASPNHLGHFIQKAWLKILGDYDISKKETIFFTSLGKHEEDKQTVVFNKTNCPQLLKEYIAIEDIIVNEEGVFTLDGRPIKVLYRLYPIEYLLKDFGPNGEEIGLLFLEHIQNKKLKVINPLSAFVTQSKALLVVMWEILKNEPHLYSEEEQVAIRQYVPYSSFEKEDFKGQPHLAKPLFGREGNGISVFKNDGSVEIEDCTPYYVEQKKIYQEYIEMPDVTIGTWDGFYTGKLLIGSFAIGGEPAGVFLRVGEEITGNLSMFVGISKQRM